MKLHSIYAENFLRLKVVSIEPQGNVVQITGPNASGKSSIFAAIFAALAGKKALPPDPVRHGEYEARVTLDLGEVVVKLRVDREGGHSLAVESMNGARFPKPQALLDSLLGSLTFDPLAFSRMKPKEQREQLAEMVGLSGMLREMDAAHRADFENRTGINRTLKERETLLASMPEEAPVEPVDVEEWMTRIKDARDHNKHCDQVLRQNESLLVREERCRLDAQRKRDEAARLLDEADALDNEADVFRQQADALPSVQPIDTREMEEQYANAHHINAQHQRQQERAKLTASVAGLRAQSDALTQQMQEREAEKARVIAAATLPIAGLGLTEDGVTYNGVPLEQASSAEQIRVSAAIGFAMNPKLRIMCIRDGSLLDENSMAMLEQMAVESDFQVIVEKVDTSGNIGIVMHEGEVVRDNQAVAA